jgi:hypothetical protein
VGHLSLGDNGIPLGMKLLIKFQKLFWRECWCWGEAGVLQFVT